MVFGGIVTVYSKLPFAYVLHDGWFASAENMNFIKLDLKRDFVMPLKTNRKLALSLEAKKQAQYQSIDELQLEADCLLTIYWKTWISRFLWSSKSSQTEMVVTTGANCLWALMVHNGMISEFYADFLSILAQRPQQIGLKYRTISN